MQFHLMLLPGIGRLAELDRFRLSQTWGLRSSSKPGSNMLTIYMLQPNY